jgi:putative SOS response-associated peptidase YedK
VDQLRWGLIPFFAKGIAGKYATHIARIETIKTLASYRAPWRRGQRCLFLAQGFYEWQLQADGKTKMPFYITTNDQTSFAIAGIWESSQPAAGEPIESAALITMPANRVIAAIHNSGANAHRMPAILRADDRDTWLNGTPDEAYSLLRPYADEHTVAWPVSTRVNKPGNNDAALIEPFDRPRVEAG